MKQSLTDFKTQFRDRLLEIIWRQWISLGVSGTGKPWNRSVIDPEALLAFSCTMARFDARLFDGIMEWLSLHDRYINTQRLKRMLDEESFSGGAVLRTVLTATGLSSEGVKWKGVLRDQSRQPKEAEPLFYMKDFRPLPVVREADPAFRASGFRRDQFQRRGIAQQFRPELPGILLLRFRALLGVNARCEIFVHLLVNMNGSPRAMAKDWYYFPATISRALREMNESGYVLSRVEGRHRYYSLASPLWKELFSTSDPALEPIIWARLFGAFEQIWHFLSRQDLEKMSQLAQASALRRILDDEVLSGLERCGLPFMFGDLQAHPAENLTEFFIQRLDTLMDLISGRDT